MPGKLNFRNQYVVNVEKKTVEFLIKKNNDCIKFEKKSDIYIKSVLLKPISDKIYFVYIIFVPGELILLLHSK